MRGRRFAEAFRIQPPNRRTPPTRVSAGAWTPAAQSNDVARVFIAIPSFVAVAKPCLCLCFGTLSHTTYSRPFRFTILHASHRRLIAERTCGGDGVGVCRRGGSSGRDRGGGKATRDAACLAGRGPRNDGARRDARVGRRPPSGGGSRTHLHRGARGGAWTPGAGVDAGRASVGLTTADRRRRSRDRPDGNGFSKSRDAARARVMQSASQRLCDAGGNLSVFRHAFDNRLPAHATARGRRRRHARERSLRGDGEVRDTPRERSNERARAASASPTSRRHRRSSPDSLSSINGRVVVVVARSPPP